MQAFTAIPVDAEQQNTGEYPSIKNTTMSHNLALHEV